MVKKVLALSTAAFVMLGALAGCGGQKQTTSSNSAQKATTEAAQPASEKKQPVKLSFLNGSVEMVDWYNDFCKKFNAANPDIQVEHEFQKEAGNIIKIKFASGDVPDVTNQSSEEFIDQGKYLELTNEDKWWSRTAQGIKELEADPKTGKNFKLDTNMMVCGIFYNKKIFAELGLKPAQTWDEFKANLKTIKEKKPEVVPYFLGGKDAWILSHTLDFIASADIKQKLGPVGTYHALKKNESDKLNFDSPKGGLTLWGDHLIEMLKEGLLNKNVATASYDNQIEAISSGKAALITQGMWAWAEIEKKNPNAKDTIGFTFTPAIVEGAKPAVVSGTDSSYLITAQSKHQAEAKKFLDVLFSAENQKAYSVARKAPSVFTDAAAEWSPLKGEVDEALKTAVKIGFTEPKPMGYNGDDQGRTVQELLVGKYKNGAEFAKVFKTNWDKAWEASNKK